jgi:hypothetical protein
MLIFHGVYKFFEGSEKGPNGDLKFKGGSPGALVQNNGCHAHTTAVFERFAIFQHSPLALPLYLYYPVSHCLVGSNASPLAIPLLVVVGVAASTHSINFVVEITGNNGRLR